MLAYSPLANGLLTGKIGLERRFSADDLRHSDPRFSPENRQRIQAALDRIRPIADGHGLTLSQTVIAWTIEQQGVTHALVGARNALHARENAGAGDAVLNNSELDQIRKAVAGTGGTAV